MAVELIPRFSVSDKVRFRAGNLSCVNQYIPARIVGSVKAVYFTQNGIALQEMLDVEFLISKSTSIRGERVPVEFRGINARDVERSVGNEQA
jgi:hypothetical protein